MTLTGDHILRHLYVQQSSISSGFSFVGHISSLTLIVVFAIRQNTERFRIHSRLHLSNEIKTQTFFNHRIFEIVIINLPFPIFPWPTLNTHVVNNVLYVLVFLLHSICHQRAEYFSMIRSCIQHCEY